jgi:hypothetical protein
MAVALTLHFTCSESKYKGRGSPQSLATFPCRTNSTCLSLVVADYLILFGFNIISRTPAFKLCAVNAHYSCEGRRPPMRSFFIYFFTCRVCLCAIFFSPKSWKQSWELDSFLDAFTALRKATVTFVMSACPSIRPHGMTRLPLDGFFMKRFISYILENLSRKLKFL